MGNIVNSITDQAFLGEIAGLLDDHKGGNTVILDVSDECSFTDFMIISSATSSRHLASLAGYVRDFLHARGLSLLNSPHSRHPSGWALLDCGIFVIHIMEQAERSFYELEKLWFRSRKIPYSSKSS